MLHVFLGLTSTKNCGRKLSWELLFPLKLNQFQPTQSHMIKKIKGKYVVLSEKTGRSFGTYKTLKEAKKRLQQIEFFKRKKKNKI